MILEFINLTFRNIILDQLAILVTSFGLLYVGIIIALLLYFFGNHRAKGVAKLLVVSLLVTYIVVGIVKYGILRPRPYTQIASLVVLNYESDPSFPSGHTALATVTALCLSEYFGHKRLFILIPLVVALSRMYIGVHYPSDVLGGFLIGIIITFLCRYLLEKWNILNVDNNNKKSFKD